MPKRYRQTRIPFRKRKLRRTSYRKRRVGKRAIPRVLRSLVERKVHDTTAHDQAIGTAGSFFVLNDVSAGDDVTDREGRKITCTSVKCKLFFHSDGTSSLAPHRGVWRVVLFIDKTPNLEAMSAGDLFLNTTPHNVEGFRIWNESFRYKVLSDKLVRTQDHALIDSANLKQFWVKDTQAYASKSMKMGTEFSSTTGSSTTITKNALYLWVCPIENSNDTYVDVNARMIFLDM